MDTESETGMCCGIRVEGMRQRHREKDRRLVRYERRSERVSGGLERRKRVRETERRSGCRRTSLLLSPGTCQA